MKLRGLVVVLAISGSFSGWACGKLVDGGQDTTADSPGDVMVADAEAAQDGCIDVEFSASDLACQSDQDCVPLFFSLGLVCNGYYASCPASAVNSAAEARLKSQVASLTYQFSSQCFGASVSCCLGAQCGLCGADYADAAGADGKASETGGAKDAE